MPGLSLGRICGAMFGAPSMIGIGIGIGIGICSTIGGALSGCSEKISSLCCSMRTGTGAGAGAGGGGGGGEEKEEEGLPKPVPKPVPIFISGSDVLILSNPDERSDATCCIGDLGGPTAPAVALIAIDSFIDDFLCSNSVILLLSCKFSSKSDFEGDPCDDSDNKRFDSNNFDFKFAIFDSSSGISILIYNILYYNTIILYYQ